MINITPTTRTAAYFGPPSHNGYDMFATYNSAEHAVPLANMAALGFNTVRTIFTANSAITGGFSFPTPTSQELANLVDYYNQIKAAGMKLHMILFSTTTYYSQIANSETWLSAMIGALPDVTAIEAFELVGEQRWASNPSGILAWNQAITAYLRTLAPSIPVVQACGFGFPDLTSCVAALKGNTGEPDWWEWHCYTGDVDQVGSLQNAISIVGDHSRLFIGEFGYNNSVGTGASDSLAMELQTQADMIQSTRWGCQVVGLPEPAIWQLYDMDSSSLFAGGQTFGLYDVNGVIKPAGQVYQSYPAGSVVPPVELLRRTVLTDTTGNKTFPSWYITRGTSGSEPITSAVNAEGNGLVLTGSSGSVTAPSLWWRPFTYPIVSAGQTYSFSVELSATGSYGTPNLAIDWYKLDGSYNGFSGGSTLSLSSTPTRYTVSGTAPANTTGIRISLNVMNNAGTINVDAPIFKGPTGRLTTSASHWQRYT